MSTKNVAAHIPYEEYLKLTEEFQENGCPSMSDYLRQVIEQRKEKTLVLQSGDVEKVKSKYEGKIEVLQQQLDKAQSELSAVTERGGLAGHEGKQENVKGLIQKALDEERTKIKQENLEKEHAELTKKTTELTEKNAELEKKVATDARIASFMETGTKVLEGFGRVNPRAAERLTNGLAGLLGGGDSMPGIGGASLTEEQQMAFQAGEAILNQFPDPETKVAVIEVTQYFAANLQALVKFVTLNRHFTGWKEQALTPQPA